MQWRHRKVHCVWPFSITYIYIPFLFDRFWLRRSCLQEYWHWIDLSNWMPFYFKWYHTWLIEYFWCVLNSCILFYIILPRYGIKCLSYLMFFKIYIYIYINEMKWNVMARCKAMSAICDVVSLFQNGWTQ